MGLPPQTPQKQKQNLPNEGGGLVQRLWLRLRCLVMERTATNKATQGLGQGNHRANQYEAHLHPEKHAYLSLHPGLGQDRFGQFRVKAAFGPALSGATRP